MYGLTNEYGQVTKLVVIDFEPELAELDDIED